MHEIFDVAQRYAEADEMKALHDDIHKHYASRSIHPSKEDHQHSSISSRKNDRCHLNYQRSRSPPSEDTQIMNKSIENSIIKLSPHEDSHIKKRRLFLDLTSTPPEYSRAHISISWGEMSSHMKWPQPLKPQKYGERGRNKRCSFHNDFGHTIECYHLKGAIEDLIRRRYLRNFVQQNQTVEQATNQVANQNERSSEKMTYKRPAVNGVINTIIGATEEWAISKSKRKVHLRSIMHMGLVDPTKKEGED
ncbi:hypothetical protein CCACVL1_18463 [Corchorus capsularis]|uniref:Uncharacterized protein n=1 Tax=Corchorus capsularis TaxID=210143 RepID=A0A1R3HLA0_COCAP|nr:hypothetical protein CCACVL1_18463 [Corchorus capsularis]